MSVRSRTGAEGARPLEAPGALTERPVHATEKKRSDRSSDIPLPFPPTGAQARRRPTAWREGQNTTQNAWREDAATCRPEGCRRFFCLPY